MGYPIKSLTVSSITVDESLQFRADGTDPEVIAEYAEAMTAGKTFPPIVVYDDEETLWLSEGFHRIAAAIQAGRTEIEAEVRPGSRDDAEMNSLGSNQIHGLKRTNRDKRNVVSEYIRFCPDWSDRRISEAAGVSNKFVSIVLQNVEVCTVYTSTGSQTSESRTGLDGKTRHVAPKALAASADPVEDSDGVDGDGESIADAGDAGGVLADAEVILSEKPAGGADAESVDEPLASAEFVGRVNRICRSLDVMKGEVQSLTADPFGRHVHTESVTCQIEAARKALWQSRPTETCNCVRRTGAALSECRACFGMGLCSSASILRGGRLGSNLK